MQGLKLDFKGLNTFVNEFELKNFENIVFNAHEMLNNKTGLGNDMLGWMDLPTNRDEKEIEKIKECAKKIQKQADVFIVVGIGGSYLGAKAVIDLFDSSFSNLESFSKRKHPQIIFAGNNMSAKYIKDLFKYIEDKDIAINVISKSGTTLEPALTFRMLKLFLEEKYGIAGAAERIYVTTDKEKGVLHDIAVKNDYPMFVVPDNVGGRYSVLTPVGLFPIAMAGIDIDEMLKGANDAMNKYSNPDLDQNDAYKYGVARQILHKAGYSAEMFVTYELQLAMVAEWWKQLYGESEGKEGKGILPTSATFSTDLHSLGQFIQEGSKVLYETILQINEPMGDMIIPNDKDDLDGLNYLAGKSVDFVNKKACQGTIDAHVNTGNVPNILITLDKMDAYSFGYMVYFFEKSCAMSVYLLGVNPFNQPGVEVYKKNMFKLLGKPGY